MTALVWCPFPDRASAEAVSKVLLEERLVACANIVGQMTSLFVWQGEMGKADECGVLFKTRADILGTVTDRLARLHPYDVPAIMGWCCDATPAATRAWLDQAVAGPTGA